MSSGAHPRYARNPGTGEDPITADRAAAVDIEVLHGARAPVGARAPLAGVAIRPVFALGAFIPLALALWGAEAAPTLVFVTSALAIVPAAAIMGDATEQLAARSGPGVGGLVNVTFGNAPELIIALFALGDGLQEVVKASIVGSIIGNCPARARCVDARRRLAARPASASIAPPLKPRSGCCCSRSSRW